MSLRNRSARPAGGQQLSGRCREEAGFTLVELVVVVVIIGILAAIAIPKFAATKERAYIAQMRNDLRNVGVSQESYWNDNHAYYAGSVPGPGMMFDPSEGITLTVVEGTEAGWSAKAVSLGTTKTCAVFYGGVGAVSPASVEGIMTCDP
jgi:prepilin-type N-terminal cleavage/methylation domain-containing protein